MSLNCATFWVKGTRHECSPYHVAQHWTIHMTGKARSLDTSVSTGSASKATRRGFYHLVHIHAKRLSQFLPLVFIGEVLRPLCDASSEKFTSGGWREGHEFRRSIQKVVVAVECLCALPSMVHTLREVGKLTDCRVSTVGSLRRTSPAPLAPPPSYAAFFQLARSIQ